MAIDYLVSQMEKNPNKFFILERSNPFASPNFDDLVNRLSREYVILETKYIDDEPHLIERSQYKRNHSLDPADSALILSKAKYAFFSSHSVFNDVLKSGIEKGKDAIWIENADLDETYKKTKKVRTLNEGMRHFFSDRGFRAPLLSDTKFIEYMAKIHANAVKPHVPYPGFENDDYEWSENRLAGVKDNIHEPREYGALVGASIGVVAIANTFIFGDLESASAILSVGLPILSAGSIGYMIGLKRQQFDDKRITQHLLDFYLKGG